MIKLKENPIEGKIINMGGVKLVVPALNLRQVKALTPDIKKMDAFAAKGETEKVFPIQVKIIREGLARNYPEITLEEVEDLVDMNNVQKVTAAVTGLKYTEPEAEAAPGN